MTHVLARAPSPLVYRFGDFCLDVAKRELREEQRIVPLPARVFECLAHLIEHRERAVGRDELGAAVFGRDDVSDAQLGQIILRARRAVGDDGHGQRLIRTIPRFGYRWMADTLAETVTSDDDDALAAAATPDRLARPGTSAAEGRGPGADGPDRAASGPPGTTPPAEQPAAQAAPAQARSPGATRRVRVAWLAIATVAVVALAVAALAWTGRAPPAAQAPRHAVLVLPTAVDGPDGAAWARLGLMAFVGERLRRAGLAVAPNENTLVLLAQMDEARPDLAHLREAANVDLIVDSRLRREDGQWQMRLSAVDALGIRHNAQARHADLLQGARIAIDRLLVSLGHAAPRGVPDLDLAERLQRAEAAQLANELDTARTILLAAPPAQRAAPQLRYRLARVQIRAGDYSAAMATLEPLLRTAPADPVFHARLLGARGTVHMRQAHIAEAERDFDAAVRLLDPQRAHAELGRALTYRGVTRSGLGDFGTALADLGQARVHLLRANDALAVARVDANLGVLELNRGRPGHALEYLRRAVGVFESFGAIQELLITRSHVLQVHLMQLQYDLGWQVGERNWAMRERAGDPGQRLTIHLDRAEVLIRRGLFEQAQALLEDPAIAAPDTAINERRRAFVQVELAWRRGQPAAVIALADAVLADWTEQPWDTTRDWVLLRRQQAALASGVAPLPLVAVEADAGATATTAAPEPSVPELLAEAIAVRAEGQAAAADAHYQAALSVAEQRGVPAEIAAVVAAYAPWLIERRRLPEAGALAGRVAPWAERDYDCALLQARLYHALGQRELLASALATARAVAGERRIPAALSAAAGA